MMNKLQQFPADVNGPVWFNKTSKEAYLTHFKRAIAFAADHKFNAYIIWGFMRDETGGREGQRGEQPAPPWAERPAWLAVVDR